MPGMSDMIGAPKAAKPTEPPELTNIEDTDSLRDSIFDRVKTAATKRFPIENERYRIDLDNVAYKGAKTFSKGEQKDALMKQKSLHRKLYGDWKLTDKLSGQTVDQKKGELIAHVPYMTERGTFIRNGSEYCLANQSRLKPGAYSRLKANKELETHFNILEGGRSFHLVMDPATAHFTMAVGGAKLNLYPILRTLGVKDDEMKAAWGGEVLDRNRIEDDSAKRAMKQFYRGEDPDMQLSTVINGMKLDPEVTAQTLGQPHSNVTGQTMLQAAHKLLGISKGQYREDDRDALHYQHMMFPDDLIAERIEKDWDRRNTGKLLWQSSRKNALSVYPGHLTPQIDAVFTKSGLAQNIEMVNPLETLDQRYRVLRTGEGGISESGVPQESRSVQPTHFGLIDPLRSPESGSIGVDSRLGINAYRGKDGQLYSKLLDAKTGELRPVSVKESVGSIVAFPGELARPGRMVRAMVNGRLEYVDRDKVQYQLGHTSHMFSMSTNMVPMMSSVGGQRALMGARFLSQALPLKDPEAPLVQNLSDDGVSSFSELYGTKVGAAVRSHVAGRVSKITKDSIVVDTPKGPEKFELYNDFPYNRKSVSGETEIVISRGDNVFRTLFKNYTFMPGDLAQTIDPESKLSAWLPVTGYLKHKNKNSLVAVQLESGRSFTVTKDHSLMVMGPFGDLVPAYPEDCIVGQTRLPVAMLPITPVGVGAAWTKRQGLLAGLYLAEGWIPETNKRNHHDIHIAVEPPERQDEVLDLLYPMSEGCDPYVSGGCVAMAAPKQSRWLISNFGRLSQHKFISDQALCASYEFKVGLIMGYLSGDGCLWADSNGAVQLAAFSASKRLRDDLVYLLASLGVFSTICSRELQIVNPRWNTAYGLRITSGHLHKLKEWMFYWDRQEKLNKHLKDKYRASPFELIPVPQEAKKRLYAGFNKVPKFVYKTVCSGSHVAKHRVSNCTGVYGKWGTSDVMWDRVINIVDAPAEEYVYDISVKNAESFAVAHGVVIHNSSIHNTPMVKPGDHVTPGMLLAKSNFTDDKGVLALGKNLRTAYMTWEGSNTDDAIVISQSAANKMTSEHIYPIKIDHDTHTQRGTKEYVSMFPTKFTTDQHKLLDDEGVVRVGKIVKPGDPLVLAVRERPQTEIHRGRKASWLDASEVWDHETDGIITDVEKDKSGARVYVKTMKSMQEADKLSGVMGDKGIVKIIPDDHMPHDSQGRPMEALINPLTAVTRSNPAQLAEAVLGKITEKTGQPYKLNSFNEGSLIDYAIAEAKKHGVSDTEDLTDPQTGRVFKNILTGKRFLMKLHFMAEKKQGMRDTGGYSMEDQPARGGPEGAKKQGVLETNALISHGATSMLRDNKTIRGQKNENYWKAFQMGYTPPSPEVPLVYKKFLSSMAASGINLKKTGASGLQIMAMTDKDVEKLSRGEITEPKGINAATMHEIPGGLFDKGITGGHHGCFHYNVQVWTDRGMLRIGDIVGQRLSVNVLSYDFDTKEFVWKPVVSWFKNKVAGLRKFEFNLRARLSSRVSRFSASTLWATPTHGVFDAKGEKHNIIEATHLLAAQEELSYSQRQVLLGGLLGDSTVSSHGHLQMGHGLKQREYLNWKAGMFSGLTGGGGVHKHTVESFGVQRTGVRFRTKSHVAFYKEYARFYGGGKKHVTPEILQDIDELGLAIWYFDDGCVARHKGKNTYYIVLCTHGFDYSSVCVLRDWLLSKWGLIGTIRRNDKLYNEKPYGWSIHLCGESALALLDLVSPYAVPCLHYKLGLKPLTVDCVRCGKPVRRHQELCIECLLAEASRCGTHKLPKHIRRRLGGTAKVRAMLAGDMPAPVNVPADVIRWTARMNVAGSLCSATQEDTAISLGVEEIQVETIGLSGLDFESCTMAYDIEVEDTHNYIANGVIVSNSNWSHISAAEPIPNPIMEEPIRRLLGMTKQGFTDILSGKEKLNGRVGGEAIQEALRRVDMKAVKARAENDIKTGAKSKRSDAIKLLRYTAMMEHTGLEPADFMLTKIPVLPPLFRPIAATANFVIKSDANSLYVDFMKHNQALKDVKKTFGHEQAGEERLNLYNSYKAITGLGETINPKLHNQEVRGLLAKVMGTGSSPKYGGFQYKVLGGTLDQSGIAVLSPDTQLDMDHVGIPENHAWTLYKKFVIRKLVQRGMKPTDAVKAVDARTAQASDVLHDEMGERPLVVNRAPTLHKYNLMGFYPTMTKGNTIRLNPIVNAGMGADHDGDTMLMHVPVSEKAVDDVKRKMMPSRNLFAIKDFDVHYLPSQEFAYGLYMASSRKKDNAPKAFDSKASAVAAYKRGEIDVDDRIRIR